MHFGIIDWKRRIADLQERLADLSTFLHLSQIALIWPASQIWARGFSVKMWNVLLK